MKTSYTMQSMAIACLLLATTGSTALGNAFPQERSVTRTAFTAAPEVFDERFQVTFDRNYREGSYRIALLDLQRQPVMEQVVEDPSQPVNVFTQHIPPGTFHVRVTDESNGRVLGVQAIKKEGAAGMGRSMEEGQQGIAEQENLTTVSARFTASPTDFDSHIRVAFHRSMVQGSYRLRLMDEERQIVIEQTVERPVKPVMILTRELAPGTYKLEVIDGHTGRSIGTQPLYKHIGEMDGRSMDPMEDVSEGINQRVLALGFHAYPELFTDQVNIKLRNGAFTGMVKVVVRNADQIDVISTVADPRNVITLDTRDVVEGRYEVEVYDQQTGSSIGVQAIFRKASASPGSGTTEPDGDEDLSRAQEGMMTSFVAYPNPFDERFTLRFDKGAINTNVVRITLRDYFSGTRVLFMSADPNRPVLVNTNHIPAGQYILEVVDGRSGRHLGTMQMRK